ncbi:MAG: hypothetical protein WBZ04_01800 [Candidatus Nanopelagicales bacterium]
MSRLPRPVEAVALAWGGSVLLAACAATSEAVDPPPQPTTTSAAASATTAPGADPQYPTFMALLAQAAPGSQFSTPTVQAALADLQRINASTNDPELHMRNCQMFLANLQQQFGVQFPADTERSLLRELYRLVQ